ncbi:EscU/YscU/HrcU family type III secretion system export apparatus switch protein [Nocardioides sp. W3-2-3]|uniref:EscU/YscU/HrcU family type III secretion system export apparatus switch protein n=1 Tax=Nocardioides convexus TaxID=2712224 RepID=UPI0024189C1E|nr:EscU/YscU/HrcU family type III secretion system export apparatus switch protein [Nocardioides convexus]NHA00586.1 EscU/YscU/HrcU family type III secretion system export apparatus switch protein [Nocardioides convexus]
MADQEKTEKPTPKRKKQARKDGQVPRTPELGGWLALLVVTLAMGPLLDHEGDALRTMMSTHLRAAEHPSVPLALTMLGDGARHVLLTLVLLGSMVLVVGVLSALAQGGFYLSPKLAKPDPKKLNPLQGAKRLFGPHALWEGVKVLGKSSVVALLAWSGIRSIMPLVGGLLPIDTVLRTATSEVSHLMLTVSIAGLGMAAADYAMMRRRIGKQTRMSHSEIKQEHKQAEGDPMVKSAIRSRQARHRTQPDARRRRRGRRAAGQPHARGRRAALRPRAGGAPRRRPRRRRDRREDPRAGRRGAGPAGAGRPPGTGDLPPLPGRPGDPARACGRPSRRSLPSC